jgi:hypothetical protein
MTAKGYTPAALVPQVFGQPRTIEGIVIHHWGALGQRHQDVVNFFVNGPGETSAHFVVSAGRIDCLVSPLDAAWHSGNAVGNATTIGIECHPEATDADYATVAELVNFLRNTYGPLPLSPHRQWNQTACPGVWDLPRIDRIAAGSAAVAPQSTPTAPKEDTLSAAEVKEIKDYMAALLVYGYQSGGKQNPGLVETINKIEGRTTPYLDAPTSAIPAKVLNQSFKLPDGTVANLSGILTAIHATPATGGVVPADPTAVVHALRDQLNK